MTIKELIELLQKEDENEEVSNCIVALKGKRIMVHGGTARVHEHPRNRMKADKDK